MKLSLKLICAASLITCITAHAEPVIKSSTPDLYGVSYSRIESRELTPQEIKSLNMNATADVRVDIREAYGQRNKPILLKSTHTACFRTALTTEADYQFVLDVGGQQTVVSEHIVIPNNQQTCVTRDLYKQFTFPNDGTYTYHASTSATTQLAGKKETHDDKWIYVCQGCTSSSH